MPLQSDLSQRLEPDWLLEWPTGQGMRRMLSINLRKLQHVMTYNNYIRSGRCRAHRSTVPYRIAIRLRGVNARGIVGDATTLLYSQEPPSNRNLDCQFFYNIHTRNWQRCTQKTLLFEWRFEFVKHFFGAVAHNDATLEGKRMPVTKSSDTVSLLELRRFTKLHHLS